MRAASTLARSVSAPSLLRSLTVSMELLFEEDLVEAVVLLCASGKRAGISPLQIRRFHRARDGVYAIGDPDERNAEFFKVHSDWFREWGFDKLLADALAVFPLFNTELQVVAFRTSRGKHDEGAELFVDQQFSRRAVIAVHAERFATPRGLASFLNHELTHVHDMVDPGFGYSPFILLGGISTVEERLIRTRYRLLWDITIDGRLVNAGRESENGRDAREREMIEAFSLWSDEKRQAVFQSLWGTRSPRHVDLFALASEPQADRRTGTLPGTACPLCRFPTFDWAVAGGLDVRVLALIQSEFAQWRPSDLVCSRCAEVFTAALGYKDVSSA